MSSKIQFKIFFGGGSIEHGPYGVLLSGFKCAERGIHDPEEKSFSAIYKWLEQGFQINRDTHILTVQTLVSWPTESILYELMSIRNTAEWKMYIDATF